jgi:hypothetical protein
MNAWANFLGYQLVWFAVVGAATGSRPWLGLAAAAAFMLVQMALSERRALDVRLLIVALVLGVAIDGTLSELGWIRYAAPAPALPPAGAPLWILALWASFSLTLTRSMAWLAGHPVWIALFGAVGGPLAYWSASRGFHALAFVTPAYRAIAGLALGWAIAMTVLFYQVRRWRGGEAAAVASASPSPSSP